jgi:non-canonical poly(A) RNA polymerase PAPD5/7
MPGPAYSFPLPQSCFRNISRFGDRQCASHAWLRLLRRSCRGINTATNSVAKLAELPTSRVNALVRHQRRCYRRNIYWIRAIKGSFLTRDATETPSLLVGPKSSYDLIGKWAERPPLSLKQVLTPWRVGILSLEEPTAELQYVTLGHKINPSNKSFRLSHEIAAFNTWIDPTPEEHALAEKCIASVRSLIRNYLKSKEPEEHLILHGSRATGLATTFSDVDFNLHSSESEIAPTDPAYTLERQQESFQELQDIANVLWKAEEFSHFLVLPARVAVLQFKHQPSGLSVQIIRRQPVRASFEFSTYFLSSYTWLHRLHAVLKHALGIRFLTSARYGGIGSYSLLVMIVASITNGSQDSSASASTQLMQFLAFWSTADLKITGFAADPPQRFSKLEDPPESEIPPGASSTQNYKHGISKICRIDQNAPQLLCLQDPANPLNDLGCKVYSIKRIQKFFGEAHAKILALMKDYDGLSNDQVRRNAISLLSPLLEANYSNYIERRKNFTQNTVEKATARFRISKVKI